MILKNFSQSNECLPRKEAVTVGKIDYFDIPLINAATTGTDNRKIISNTKLAL